MFKKIVLITASLVFATGVLLTSVFRTSAQTCQQLSSLNNQVLAEEVLEFEVNEEGEEATPEPEEKLVEYDLTWPGILPDHFLYPVKMLRDRVWLFLTTEPLKKAELLLRLADKRIWSAQMLVDKEKADLAATTATKAEKYLERAINQEAVAREKGKETQALLERLSKAVLKHEEVLLDMLEKVPESVKPVFGEALEYPQKGYEEVMGRLGE